MKKTNKKLRITEADYILAHRRAARLEEIALHGKPVSMRSVKHKSKKLYDRKRLRRVDIGQGDLSPELLSHRRENSIAIRIMLYLVLVL